MIPQETPLSPSAAAAFDPPPSLSLPALLSALECLAEGFALYGPDDRLVLANQRVRELFPEIAHLIQPGMLFDDLMRALVARGGVLDAVGQEPQGFDARLGLRRHGRGLAHLRRPGGRSIGVTENATPDGGSVAIYRDFTELRQRDDELNAANQVIDRTDQLTALGELIAGITHEIKNSLSLMSNFSEISADLVEELRGVLRPLLASADAAAKQDVDELIETLIGNLTTIGEHGQRADGIVRSMLQSSRSGGAMVATDVNRMVEDALRLSQYGTHASTPGFKVITGRQLDPAAGMTEVDPQEINRVLLNLFSNAFHAMHRRMRESTGAAYQPALSVRSEGLPDRVLIHVRDNGTGIAPEHLDRVFARFFTTKPAGEGTGLGLALCQDIVRRHGGRLSVSSVCGEYAEFSLELLRHAPPPGAAA